MFVISVVCQEQENTYGINDAVTNKAVVRAIVESCGGWRLNRLPEVRAFIREDLPFFHNAEFKQLPGHNPDLVLVNENSETVERVDLSPFNREQCNQLLKEKGFYRKQAVDDVVPEEFMSGPYKPKEDL